MSTLLNVLCSFYNAFETNHRVLFPISGSDEINKVEFIIIYKQPIEEKKSGAIV